MRTQKSDWLCWCRLPACAVLYSLLALVGGASPGARAEDPKPAAETPTAEGIEYFEKHVRPVLVKHCYECHSGAERNGGLSVESRGLLLAGGDSGPALVSGKPDASLLVEAIGYQNRDLQMPPKNPLSAAEVAALRKWVALGAPDPRSEPGEAAAGPAPTGMSIADGQRFWSFQPVADPAVPAVSNQAWVRNPIDAFVLARLEQAGIEPAPRADKRTLIRRVTFDLTGLPPTPAEVQAYLEDESPQAFQRVVERLLNSPHYGVRWGRHWLDVARYADSNGLDENLAFGNAWRYRDYVIQAFNQDKPFDQFVIEQLAGDLLPHADRDSRTATGFLALGAKVLAEPDREKLAMDTIDEQLDTLGKALLGMTFGCVRCHDHKFDPLKQSDYYALAAIFKSTRTFADSNTGAIKHWYEHSFATPEDLAEIKQVNAAIAAKNSAASSFKSRAMSKLRADAEAKAALYLRAAAGFDTQTPLTRVAELAAPLGLHPRILHHCRLHLEYHLEDPFFAKWAELAEAGAPEEIQRHYGELFAEAEAAWAALRKESPQAKQLDDPRLQAARDALHDPSGFLVVPPKPEFAFDPETLAEYNRLMEEARLLESGAADEPAAMGVADGSVVEELAIHVRGSHLNLGDPVKREFPEVMRTSPVRPIFPSGQSGRLELARWIASTQHPLTARVYVNRVWRWHFGRGLVASTENFGQLGDRPSHPLLLDWLARQFMQAGWSTKELHRLILASETYQMASRHPQPSAAEDADPENRLLWKFRLRRLEAEAIRDAILAVSGRLDYAVGGKTVPLRNRQFVFNHTSVDHTKYDSLRRAAYLPVIRNNLYTLFEQFDFPDPTMPTGSRNSTIVAPQALLLMNADLVQESADSLATRLLARHADPRQRVRAAYELALGRPPAPAEIARCLEFVGQLTSGAQPLDRGGAWALVCQSLLASNEFVFVR